VGLELAEADIVENKLGTGGRHRFGKVENKVAGWHGRLYWRLHDQLGFFERH